MDGCDVAGEATRLMAWIIKNSRAVQVMRNLVRAEGVQHLVTMATSEHLVMQNEALLALNLVASTVLGKGVSCFGFFKRGGGAGGGDSRPGVLVCFLPFFKKCGYSSLAKSM